VNASGAVFLAVLVSAVLTVVAVIAMPGAQRADANTPADAKATSGAVED
jgi:hypothetical protein